MRRLNLKSRGATAAESHLVEQLLEAWGSHHYHRRDRYGEASLCQQWRGEAQDLEQLCLADWVLPWHLAGLALHLGCRQVAGEEEQLYL